MDRWMNYRIFDGLGIEFEISILLHGFFFLCWGLGNSFFIFYFYNYFIIYIYYIYSFFFVCSGTTAQGTCFFFHFII